MNRMRRTNLISPKERLAVPREDAANLFSISPSFFDELVAEDIFPPPTYLHGEPRWDVRQLCARWDKLIGEPARNDAWSRAAL